MINPHSLLDPIVEMQPEEILESLPAPQVYENLFQGEMEKKLCANATENELTYPFPPSGEDMFDNLEQVQKSAKDNTDITEYEASEQVLKACSMLTINGELYIFDHPAYRRVTDNEALVIIKETFRSNENILREKSMSFWRGVLCQIKTAPIKFRPDPGRKADLYNFVFRNGVYNVKTGYMRNATPEDYFFTFNDVDFVPNKADKCKHTPRFFEQFSGGDPTIQRRAWEIIGCCLSQHNTFRKFFMLYGATSSGKSVLGKLIESLVGPENCSHIGINSLSTKFGVYNLAGKQLNTCLDLSSAEIKDIGILKQLTGGGTDTIQCEGKYQQYTVFAPDRIKLLFACNVLPSITGREDSRPFYERMLLLPFAHTVPAENRDPVLLSKLLKEKNFIVSQALEHYKNFVSNEMIFSSCAAADEILERFIPLGQPLEAFVNDCCRLEAKSKESNDDIYEAYIEWCQGESIPAMPRGLFIERLRKTYNLSTSCYDTFGRRKNSTTGIMLLRRSNDENPVESF